MVPTVVRTLTAQDVSHVIISTAMRVPIGVHSELGPGLLEIAYTACLQHELRKTGYQSIGQLALPVVYDGVKLDLGYRIDLLVENLVVEDLKSVDAIAPVHQAKSSPTLSSVAIPSDCL